MDNEKKAPEALDETEEEVQVFTLTDEDGNESDFELIAQLEDSGVMYYALIPVGDNDKDEVEYVILKAEKDEEGDAFVTIDDEAEFDHIADKFDEMFNEVDYDA